MAVNNTLWVFGVLWWSGLMIGPRGWQGWLSPADSFQFCIRLTDDASPTSPIKCKCSISICKFIINVNINLARKSIHIPVKNLSKCSKFGSVYGSRRTKWGVCVAISISLTHDTWPDAIGSAINQANDATVAIVATPTLTLTANTNPIRTRIQVPSTKVIWHLKG